jgi:hypothetical protein
MALKGANAFLEVALNVLDNNTFDLGSGPHGGTALVVNDSFVDEGLEGMRARFFDDYDE